MTEREQSIISALIETRSYTKAGAKLGLSRQRVEQVVKKYRATVPLLAEIVAAFNIDHSDELCTVCRRSFKIARYGGKGICTTCYAFAKNARKRPNRRRMIRLVLKPTACVLCGVPFSGKNGRSKYRYQGNGLCGACYAKTPAYKARQKAYVERRVLTPVQRKVRNAYQRDYQRRKRQENPEKYRLRSRIRWARKIQQPSL